MRKLSGMAVAVLGILTLSHVSPAEAQSRSPWEMHDGLEPGFLGLIAFSCSPVIHGDICEYDVATIPPEGDGGWGAAPDPDTIGFSIFPSRVCSAPITCMAYGDFTYFQTFVDIPADVVVTTFTIAFSGMDDGSRVTLFNSTYPGGFVVPGSYVFLGGSGTTDLSALVVSGEVNRVVVTQVDDCCIENNLHSAVVVLNGEIVDVGCSGPEECDDENACTTDVCNSDGSCTNLTISCDDGNACTIDACDQSLGCSNEDQCPDCSGAGPTVATLWPPNHKYRAVGVTGITDPQGQSTGVTIDAVFQDEPTDGVADGNTCPDAAGIGTDTALVRAERAGTEDGRVYLILFTATDPDGYSCTGEVNTCVPHDQGAHSVCVDQGPLYDSLICEP